MIVSIFFIFFYEVFLFWGVFGVEFVIIVVLMFVILVLGDENNGVLCGVMNLLLIGIVIVVIGLFLGLLIGFVMNLVCDFGLKFFFYIVGWEYVFFGVKVIFYFIVFIIVFICGVCFGVWFYFVLIGCFFF